MKKKRNRNKRSFAMILALLFGIIAVFIGLIVWYQLSRAPRAKTTEQAVSASASTEAAAAQKTGEINAAKYYAENAQKVIRVTPARSSDEVYSEKAVGEELSARGFGDKISVTYEYSIDGSVEQKAEIDDASLTTHPQYTAVYMTESGDYWTISVCNNCVSAYPVTYNLEHNSGTEVILTESESITAYDSATNCFYEAIPKQSVLLVKRIPAITAQALEKLTAEEIEKL